MCGSRYVTSLFAPGHGPAALSVLDFYTPTVKRHSNRVSESYLTSPPITNIGPNAPFTGWLPDVIPALESASTMNSSPPI